MRMHENRLFIVFTWYLSRMENVGDSVPSKKQCGAVITWSIFTQILTKGTHSSPVHTTYDA